MIMQELNILGKNEMKELVDSFMYSYFDYCPLVWMLSTAKSIAKFENLQKRAFPFVLNNY